MDRTRGPNPNQCLLLVAASFWRPKAAIDRASRPNEFGHQLAYVIIAVNYSMFADTQTPEAGKFPGQRGNVAFLPGVYLIKGAPYVPPNVGMQRLEGVDDLIRELQAGTLSDSR